MSDQQMLSSLISYYSYHGIKYMRWQIGDTGSFSTYVLAINVLDISNQAGKYFGK